MDKQKIIDYVLDTPTNTNPRILGQMLEEYATGGGETWNTVFEGDVTTLKSENIPNPSGPIKATLSGADRIKVTFNGTEYECEKKELEGDTYYGADPSDFSEYPFILLKGDGVTFIFTPEAGTYSLKIEEPQSGGSSDFAFANVTVVNNKSDVSYGVFCANYVEAPPQAGVSFSAVTRGYAGASRENNPVTAKVILYQGYALVQIGEANDPDATYEVEGNGSVFQRNNILVTGNCTITIS